MDNIEYFRDKDGRINKKYKMGGHSDSFFARVPKDSYSVLVNALQDENCSYVTTINDLIKSGYVPEYTSAFVKKSIKTDYDSISLEEMQQTSIDPDGMLGEVLGSRLLNLFQVPTVFNTLANVEGVDSVVSIDYVNPNEQQTTFENAFDLTFYFLSLDKNKIEDTLKNLDNKKNIRGLINNYKIDKDKIKSDLLIQSFIRERILNDQDFTSKNFVVLKNKTDNYISPAPAFDFEFIIKDYWQKDLVQIQFSDYEYYTYSMCEYLYKKYPELLKDIYNKLNIALPKIKDTILNIFDPNIEGESAIIARNKLMATLRNIEELKMMERGDCSNLKLIYKEEYPEELVDSFVQSFATNLTDFLTNNINIVNRYCDNLFRNKNESMYM